MTGRFSRLAGPAIAVLLAVSAAASAAAPSPPLAGEMRNLRLAPAPVLGPRTGWADADGKSVSLADFKGRVVLVNVWATWCAPCIRELPSLDRLQAGLGGKDFTVVALNVDRGGKPAAGRMFRQLKLRHLAIYLDPRSKASRALGVSVMPTTFLFDATGREIGRIEGPAQWDSADAVRLIKYVIANPGGAADTR